MDAAVMQDRLRDARVATLATLDARGAPHLVPVCFAWTPEGQLVTAVDHKPKRTTALARLEHVRANPAVSLLAHHYEDDWGALWWVRVDGYAHVVDDPSTQPVLVESLAAKYVQYAERRPSGPAIVVAVERWSGWSARGDPAA